MNEKAVKKEFDCIPYRINNFRKDMNGDVFYEIFQGGTTCLKVDQKQKGREVFRIFL